MSIFKGAGVAIVTPMKNNEEVNYDRLEQMIEYQINQGTDCMQNTVFRSLQEPVQTVQERQSTFRKKRKKPAWMDCSA